jgi:hypothetical protein
MTTQPTPAEVLALPLEPNDSGADTVRGYLTELLRMLWREEAGFNSKRPFGYSDWVYDVYKPLINAGWVKGTLDEDGYVEEVDFRAADALMDEAIKAMG